MLYTSLAAAGPSTLETPDPPNGSGFAFDCQGDSLSPEHPKNFCIAPVVEGGKEHFYCHLCSFCGEYCQFGTLLDWNNFR